MKSWLVAGFLLTQAPSLEEERLRTHPTGSDHAMIVVIAQHADGSPARGYIRCSGDWYKHEDDPDRRDSAPNLPFVTDSRGAVIFNPSLDTEWMVCWFNDEIAHTLLIEFDAEHPRQIHRLLVP